MKGSAAGWPRIPLFEAAFFIFMCGFFFMPQIKWQNNLFYALILVPYIIMFKPRSFTLLFRSRIFLAVMLFVGYCVTTLLWGARGTYGDYSHTLTRSVSVMVFYVLTIELSLADERFRGRVYSVLSWVALAGAAAAVYLTHYDFAYPPARLADIGALRSPIQAGSVYGMALVILYYQFLSRDWRWYSVFYLVLFIALLGVLLLTQSRGPLLALMLAFIAGSLVSRDLKMLVILALIASGVWMLVSSGEGFFYDLIITRGSSYRLEIFQCVFKIIQEKILFGHGMLMKFTCTMSDGTLVSRTHNLFLAAWIYGGLVGLSLFVAFLARAFWVSAQYYMRKNDCTYIALMIFSITCVSTGNHNAISNPHPLYLFFWMPLGFITAFELSGMKQYNQDGDSRTAQV